MFKDKRVKYAVLVLAVIVAVVGFRIYRNVSANREKALASSKVKTVAVKLDKPKRQDIRPVIKLSGNLAPAWQADVSPKVEARVRRVYVDVGSVVREGDLLAELDLDELRASAQGAQGSLYDARAALLLAEQELKRTQYLFSVGGKSQAELDAAVAARDQAQGKVNNSAGQHEVALSKLEGAELRAPHDGVVIKRYYQEGYFAKTTTPLFNIADTTALTVKVDIPEGQIGYVDRDVRIEIEVPALQNRRLDARLTKLAPVADLPARTFAAEVTVDNTGSGLLGGLFANIYIHTKEKKNVLTIPEKAVILREDQRTVYVVGEDGRVVRRVLATGFIGDNVVEVLGGLKETDTIVVSGQNRIKEGSLVKNSDVELDTAKKDGK